MLTFIIEESDKFNYIIFDLIDQRGLMSNDAMSQVFSFNKFFYKDQLLNIDSYLVIRF